MEINKEVESNAGAMASYWEPKSFSIDALNKNFTIELSGYVSKVAKSEGKQPLIIRRASFELSKLTSSQLADIFSIVQSVYLANKPYFDIEESLPDPDPEPTV